MNDLNIYTNFKKQIGVVCNCNQYIELTIRSFYKDHLGDVLIDNKMLDNYSKELSLSIAEYPKSIKNNVSCLYIVNIHSCFEEYLQSFCGLLGSPVKDEDIKESKDILKTIIDVVYKNKTKDNVIDCLYNVCKYYRLIRNRFIHKHSKDNQEIKEAKRQIEKQDKLFFQSKRFNKLSAPHGLENISFDDFVLFSRSSIDLAKRIFDDSEYNTLEILEQSRDLLHKMLGHLLENKKRVVEKTRRYFERFYPKKVFNGIKYSDIIPYLEH